MNIKIVITGGLTQLVFGKKLSGTQWMALTLLAVGCRYLPNSQPSTEPSLPTTLDMQSKQIGLRHVVLSEPRVHTHAGMGLPSCAGAARPHRHSTCTLNLFVTPTLTILAFALTQRKCPHNRPQLHRPCPEFLAANVTSISCSLAGRLLEQR